jgi:hypothetical protein
MTKFVQSDFEMGSGSDRWVYYGPTRRFVGRFKHKSPAANSKAFVKFLIANFTVEEYFGMLDGSLNGKRMAPAEILHTKGYVSPNEKSAREAMARIAAEKARGPMKLIFV